MGKAVIIVAGGVGRRAGGDRPKQFVSISGCPMIIHTIKAFTSCDAGMKIIVVMHKDFIDEFGALMERYAPSVKVEVCEGGVSRCESVYNGLLALKSAIGKGERFEDCKVAVHDAARPLIDSRVIIAGFESVKRGFGSVPGVACVNSLRKIMNPDDSIKDWHSASVPRREYVEVQTPQVFYAGELLNAYKEIGENYGYGEFTDDASVAEASGMSIIMYEGGVENIKVTHPIDFEIAALILNRRRSADETKVREMD